MPDYPDHWAKSAHRRISNIDALLRDAETHTGRESTSDAIAAARDLLHSLADDVAELEALAGETDETTSADEAVVDS